MQKHLRNIIKMMRRKKLPSGKHKGLCIYCNRCKKHFYWTQKKVRLEYGDIVQGEPICGASKKVFSKCRFHHFHRFKSRIHISGSYDRKKSKVLNATNYNDAVVEAIAFEKEVKQNQMRDSTDYSKIRYLFDAQLQYIDFLDNIGVPEHLKVKRSEKHIKEVQKSLALFNEALASRYVNKSNLRIDRITDKHVGHFHSYLLNDKSYAAKTYNNKMGVLKSFYKWAIETYRLNVINPFAKVKERVTAQNNDTITKREFENLLEMITPENGLVQIGITRQQTRNRYKPFLKDGIELALHTGGRREEIVELKWNMIKKIDNEIAYIEVPNFKVIRQLGEGFNTNVPPKIIPITKGLKDILFRLSYLQNKDKDQYILVPNRSGKSAKSIMDDLSKGFTHFYKLLNTGKQLQLKSLRKTYLTYLHIALKDDTKLLSSHTTDQVLDKHYIDKRVISKAIHNLKVLGG